MDNWVLEWSQCDPYQCWAELWGLWWLDGVRDQLSHPHNYIEMVDYQTEALDLIALGTTWGQFRN